MSLTCPEGYEFEDWPDVIKLSRAPKYKVLLLNQSKTLGCDAATHDGSDSEDAVLTQADEVENEELEYEVEDLLDVRGSDESIKYLVKWKGYSSVHNSWEPFDALEHCQALRRKFRKSWHEAEESSLSEMRASRKRLPTSDWPTLRWKHLQLWRSNEDDRKPCQL